MKEETKNTWIVILTIILVCGSIAAVSYFVTKPDSQIQKINTHSQIESDLCYSLKVNRLMLEDYKKNYGIIEGIKNFESALVVMEYRNWLGCEE